MTEDSGVGEIVASGEAAGSAVDTETGDAVSDGIDASGSSELTVTASGVTDGSSA